MPLLDIQDLHVEFRQTAKTVTAVEGVSLQISPGETVGLVGESGSGKSVTALSIAQLIPSPPVAYPKGRILLEGLDTLTMSQAELRHIRGRIVSYVFQDPGSSLNPVFRIGSQIKESLHRHRPSAATDAEVLRLLRLVGIPAPEARIKAYPHEMSGGMQQRAMIAMALASQPKLLVADEPTTALDVTIQAQIIDLLHTLKSQLGMAILLITHNLGIVGDIADRLVVMYAGQIVEAGPTRAVLTDPKHPYTQALIRSVPQLGANTDRLISIPGNVPSPGSFPTGCRFHPRCADAQSSCRAIAPSLQNRGEDRSTRCPVMA